MSEREMAELRQRVAVLEGQVAAMKAHLARHDRQAWVLHQQERDREIAAMERADHAKLSAAMPYDAPVGPNFWRAG